MTQSLIQQIADELGVSIEQVNDVIAGMRDADDERLRGIIRRLSVNGEGVYILAVWKGPTQSLNTLRNTPSYNYFGQILESLNLTLDKKGYTSRLLVSNLQLVDYAYFEGVIARHPRAGIVNITGNLTGDLKRVCEAHQRPIVYLDFPVDSIATDQYIVGVSSQPATVAVVEHLYQLGHRRIAFIKGLQNKVNAIDRFEGYKTGLMQVGLAYDATLVADGDWQPESGEAAAEKLLALEHPPTAIIASNDVMAFGVMHRIRQRGLKIPDQLSVVGFDDIAAAAMASPPLTSVRTPMSDIGAKAGETIIDLLEGRVPEPRQVYFPLEFMVRESIGPAPAHDAPLI